MNATLQCLANIKPVTKYLLDPNNYCFLYNNLNLCLLTMEYIQVLIGLYCDDSRNGSYCPQNFKNIISEYNPLFKGVQANDSKDLIIFLLEYINNELVKIQEEKQKEKNKNLINIIGDNNNISIYQQIDPSNESMVLAGFLSEYKKTHRTVIGDNLCGFQKSYFLCQYCGKKAINFNIFNFLIFTLEATSNYFNLNYNNMVPFITFDHCFQFLSKEENFQNTYCQFCGQIGNSKYSETIYTMPKYLIIILNRGKGNVFNCNVQILERFCPANYVENDKYNYFNLIGVVSHLGESGMGGHFIAFCKHNIDGKWRCYNDSVVTECKNDYLQKGTPYILFYQKEEPNSDNFASNINTNNIINQQSNYMNNIQQMNFNNYQNMNNNFPQNINNINTNFEQNYDMNINMNNIQQNMNNNLQEKLILNNNYGNNYQQSNNFNNNNNFQFNDNQNINNNYNNLRNYQQNYNINNNLQQNYNENNIFS